MRSRRWRPIAGIVAASLAATSLAGAETVDELGNAGSVSAGSVARSTTTRCPRWPMTFSEQRTEGVLIEVSGIAGSRLRADHWWVHNDSGDSARAFLIDSTLAITAEVQLDGVFALDIEDIAIDAAGMVWLADVGDNLKIRPSVTLYGFAEVTSSRTVPVRRIEITYPDRAHDVETLMIDPRTGDGFLVDKRIPLGVAPVFRIPARMFATGGSVTVEEVGAIDVSGGGEIGPTAGDISPDGSTIVVKTLTTAFLWSRPRGMSIPEVLAAEPAAPCTIADAGSNEAIGFDREGRRLAALSEGIGTRLRTFTRSLG